VVADSILHYGMSDQDAWEIVRDHFNPRCRDRQGKPYPWRKEEVAWAVEIAHQPGSYSTLDQIRGAVDITNALAHERARGERANARRVAGQRRAKGRDYANIRGFLGAFYEQDDAATLTFDDLLRAVNRALVYDESEPVPQPRLGNLPREDWINSARGGPPGLGWGLAVAEGRQMWTCQMRWSSCRMRPTP